MWDEYKAIKGILDKIQNIGTGPVDLNDPNAREILAEQLSKEQESLERKKAVNAYWKKHKTSIGCPGISENTAAAIDAAMNDETSFTHLYNRPFPDYSLSSTRNKIKRIQNRIAELDKLQAEQKAPVDNMKFHGFHWSPRNKAWQRQLTQNAEYDAKQIVGIA